MEDGKLTLLPVAMTSPSNWETHPKVEIDGNLVELDVGTSAFPTPEWFSGEGFVYEDGSHAPPIGFDMDQFPKPMHNASIKYRTGAQQGSDAHRLKVNPSADLRRSVSA